MPSELHHWSGLDIEDARRVIEAALAEDVGSGDITSFAVIPEDVRFHGVMRARHAMVIAGLPVAREVFRMVVPDADFRALVTDGDAVVGGAILAEIEGPARGLLTAERTALNLLQILSGIATATANTSNEFEGPVAFCSTRGRPFLECANYPSTRPAAGALRITAWVFLMRC